MGPPTTCRSVLAACLAVALLLAPPLVAAQVSYFNGMAVTVSPASIPVHRSSVVTVELASSGSPAPGHEVAFCGASLDPGFPASAPSSLGTYRAECAAIVNTSAQGTATALLQPISTASPVHVYIDGAHAGRSIAVSAGALSYFVQPGEPRTSDTVLIAVYLPDGSAPPGSLVSVWSGSTYVAYQVSTDVNGRIAVGTLPAGTYFVTASRSGYDDATGSFTVAAATAPDLRVVSSHVPSRAHLREAVEATMDVVNVGSATGTAHARLLLDGAPVSGQGITLAAGTSTTLRFAFLLPTEGSHTVQMDLDGVQASALWTIVGVAAPPEFVLQDVVIPPQVDAGEAFEVLATVHNPGTSGATARMTLNVSGGTEVRDVFLPAGASQQVVFTQVAAVPGDLLVTVSVGAASAAATMRVERATATFTLSPLKVPSEVVAGASYQASVTLTNVGRATGSAVVMLVMDDVTQAALTRTLGPGGSVTVAFEERAPATAGIVFLDARVGEERTPPVAVAVVAARSAPTVPTPSPTTATPRVELRAPDGTALAGTTAVLLGAGANGALVSKGAVRADTGGRIVVDRAKASHVAVPDGDGLTIVPVPASGRIVLPPSLTAPPAGFDEAARVDLAARFQDARVFPVDGASRRVTVGYAGLDSVEIETSSVDARLIVTRYDGKPLAGVPAPPGTAYHWFELHLARPDGGDAALTSATVRFARPAGAAADDALALFHYDAASGQWEVVEARSQDGGYAASVGAFSLFAVGTVAPAGAAPAWLLPALGAVGLVALGAGAAILVPRAAKRAKRGAPSPMPPASDASPEEPAPAPPAPPPPPPLVRRAAPRRPLAGDVVFSGVGVRTGGKTFLEDVSFRAPRGALTAIVGPPGAGKAMALLAILGDAPTLGVVDVGGMRPAEDQADLRRAIGASAAGAKLDPERTVESLFDAIADKRALPVIDARMRGERVLALLGSSATGETRLGDLSTPEERRVLIAAALAHEPELLLLDEPTVGLPDAERRALWEGIHRVKEDLGLTVIATTQTADEARASDAVVMLESGRLVASGTPASLAALLPP